MHFAACWALLCADLRRSFTRLVQGYVPSDLVVPKSDADVVEEYDRQREYLEQSVEALRKKLKRDQNANRADTMRLMQRNMELINEINTLREEVESIRNRKQQQRLLDTREHSGSKSRSKPTTPAHLPPVRPPLPGAGAGQRSRAGTPSKSDRRDDGDTTRSTLRQIDSQRAEIGMVREDIRLLEEALRHAAKPVSRIRPGQT